MNSLTSLRLVVNVGLLLGCCYAVPFDIPPQSMAPSDCGLYRPAISKTSGQYHYFAFPSEWSVAGAVLLSVVMETDFADAFGNSVPVPVTFNLNLGSGSVSKGQPALYQFNYTAYTGNAMLIVTADHDITAWIQASWTDLNNKTHSVFYWSIPREELGQSYVVATETASSSVNFYGDILIGAPEYGNTNVTVRLATDTNLVVNYGGTTFKGNSVLSNIIISSGRVAKILATAGDLTGTIITANNYIAVWSGNGPLTGGTISQREAIFEMLPPTTGLGQTYITTVQTSVNYPSNSFLNLKVVAAQNFTVVYFQGNQYPLLKPGDQLGIPVKLTSSMSSSGPLIVRASKPVFVAQFLGTDLQNTLTALPPYERWVSAVNWMFPTHYRYTVLLQGRAPMNASIKLNGNAYPIKWVADPKNSGLAAGWVNVVSGMQSLASSLTTFGATFYGVPLNTSVKTAIGSSLGINLDQRRCYACQGTQCDWRDNDCDGKNNEEICDGLDDDGDGMIDEDCCGLIRIPGIQIDTATMAAPGGANGKPSGLGSVNIGGTGGGDTNGIIIGVSVTAAALLVAAGLLVAIHG